MGIKLNGRSSGSAYWTPGTLNMTHIILIIATTLRPISPDNIAPICAHSDISFVSRIFGQLLFALDCVHGSCIIFIRINSSGKPIVAFKSNSPCHS